MKHFDNPAALREWSEHERSLNHRIALVPTMGYLHPGHLSLVELARAHADRVVASIFVNPAQFGPKEDLERYPRDAAGDLEKLRSAHCDAVFAPSAAQIYPPGFQTYVEPGALGDALCGESRPGHFRGVCTVVALLLRISLPHVLVLGEKDFQQLQIIKRMVEDLWLDVRVVPAPIVREHDGLAMSSRNAYLSASERETALEIPRTLDWAVSQVSSGEHNAFQLVRRVRKKLEQTLKVDYAKVVDAETLVNADRIGANSILVVAAFSGATRLIDNRRLS